MAESSVADRLSRVWNDEPSRRPQLAANPDLPAALWPEAAARHPLEASANPAFGLATLEDPRLAARLAQGLRAWTRDESQAGQWGPERQLAIHEALARIPAVIAGTLFENTPEQNTEASAALARTFSGLLDDERTMPAARAAMEAQGAAQVAAWLLDIRHRELLLRHFRNGDLPAAPIFRLSDPPRIFNPDLSPAHILARAALADADAGLGAWLDTDDPDIADGVADEIRWAHAEKPVLELLDACLRSHAERHPANARMVQRWLEPPELAGTTACVGTAGREIAQGPIGGECTKGRSFRLVAQRSACDEIGRWSGLVRDALARKDDVRLIFTAIAGACRRTDWPIELRAIIAHHLRAHDGGEAMRTIEQEPVGDEGLGLRLSVFIKRLSQGELDALHDDRVRGGEATEPSVDIAVLRGLHAVAIRHL